MISRWSPALVAVVLVVAGAAGCGGNGKVQIYNVKPREGVTKGSTQVTIQGQNFRKDIGYTVYFGGNKAQKVTIASAKKLLVMAPKRDEAGTVDLIVTSDDGSAWRVHEAFHYKEAASSPMQKVGEGQEKGKLKY